MISPGDLAVKLAERHRWLEEVSFVDRLGAKDGTLWSSDPAVIDFVESFLGWVDVPSRTLRLVPEIVAFREKLLAEGISDAVVLGMGGSSLSALMFAEMYPEAGGLRLHVLDSTVPADVARIREAVVLDRTVFIVASKSGTTVEPLAMEEFFWAELQAAVGEDAKRHMVAITDPGSEMEARAKSRGYRKIFLGEPEVGGRFSVFSPFGIVPAGLSGLDISGMLKTVVLRMPGGEAGPRAGLELGSWLGELSLIGVDKVTFVSKSPGTFGLWAEQLVAESTGKGGKGVLPLALEPFGEREVYGRDRCFYVFGEAGDLTPLRVGIGLHEGDLVLERKVSSQIELAELLYDWEVATAVSGAILGVNPFDQPNVQQAKDIAKKRLTAIQETGTVSLGEPEAEYLGVSIYGGGQGGVAERLSEFLNQATVGDHVAFLAFLPETEEATAILQRIRKGVRDRTMAATSLGYGPRYLHSTGQFHKGGPNNGLFVVFTAEDALDFEIPGMGVSFGQLKTAQALGDIGALEENGRRVIHVHLGEDVVDGLGVVARSLGV